MGEIRLSVGQVNISNWLKINVREVGNPTAIVDHLDVPPPVPASQNILFSGLNPVVHYVDFRESPDGVAQGTLLATFVYDVKEQSLIAERRYYTCDGGGANDPVLNDTSITDLYLSGKTVYGVFKEGFRYLKPTTEWTQVGATINIFAGGPLQTGEVVAIEINFTVDQPGGGNAVSFPSGVVDVPADVTLDSTHYDKLMEANGSGTILTITMADFLTIPDGKRFAFNTHKGNQRYLAIVINDGNYCQVGGHNRTTLWMGKGEELEVIKKGSYLRIISWPGDWRRVGELIKCDMPPLNGLAETGGWYDIADYPRLYYWYVADLDPSLLGIGSYAAGTPAGDQARKWVIDVVAGKFWVPDTGGYFDRNTDPDGNTDQDRPSGDRKPGTAQSWATNLPTLAGGLKLVKSHSGAGGMIEGYGTNTAPGSDNYDPVDWSVTGSTTETRPININRNAYRII
jgi:hypothetical protein